MLENLIINAQIQVLYTQQATGIKLKLLKSLYNGRHCIANNKILIGTELENVCHVVEKPEEWLAKIKELENTPFSSEEIEIRKKTLEKFNCIDEAKKNYSVNLSTGRIVPSAQRIIFEGKSLMRE